MKIKTTSAVVLAVWVACGVRAQDVSGEADTPSFSNVSQSVQRQLRDAEEELAAVQKQVMDERLPMDEQMRKLEGELADLRQRFQETSRALDTRTLDNNNLGEQIKRREDESAYLANLFSEYARNFESRLGISEFQRYQKLLDEASASGQNATIGQSPVFADQLALLDASIKRLEESLDLTRFAGAALDASGVEHRGEFLLIGPVGLFRSDDGSMVGTVESRLNSTQPAVIAFADPGNAATASRAVSGEGDILPVDPTLGDAHKIEQTQETQWEHIQKGGPVMVPIFALAGAALLVALYKWIALLFVRRPSQKKLRGLLAAVTRHDLPGSLAAAKTVGGPAGRMLTAGVEHFDEPRELIEEVMYETVLSTRLKVQRWLPFIAVSAASAPLLGLLGTVTGIINTFKLITVYGSGDVRMLSGGISEALITTEYGLIVAIPSLLLHAFLSRKARGVVDQMEKAAISFVNQVAKSRTKPLKPAA